MHATLALEAAYACMAYSEIKFHNNDTLLYVFMWPWQHVMPVRATIFNKYNFVTAYKFKPKLQCMHGVII